MFQPSDLIWTQLAQKGEVLPKPRSGHTLTWVGGSNYVMYGGIEDPETSVKVVPNSDVWSLKLLPSKYRVTAFEISINLTIKSHIL